MKRNLLFLLVFVGISTAAFSQKRSDEFKPQTYIYVGGGGLLYWGENDSHRSVQYRITPALDAGIGHWFTPAVGARLQYSGLAARGSSLGDASKFRSGLPYVPGGDFYKKQFNLNYVHADFLWNISNTISGYRADRPWDFVPYVGLGWANANKDDVKSSNSLGVDFGLINKIRISPRFDMTIDTRIVFVNEGFDGVKHGNKLEYWTSATLGFSYYFKKREVAPACEEVDLSGFHNRIGSLERDLSAAQSRANQLERDLAACNARQPERIVTTEVIAAPLAIFFPIDKSILTDKEMINLGYIAEVIKKTPDKTYTIFGSADRQTGSPVYNQGLSERRAQAVADALVNQFGVNRNQLRLNAVGDTQQRFDKQILNRVVVIENP